MILLDDIFVYVNEDMPDGAREMVCPNSDGTYTVLINSSLDAGSQTEAFWHAIRHIQKNDFERVEAYGVQAIEADAHRKGGKTS